MPTTHSHPLSPVHAAPEPPGPPPPSPPSGLPALVFQARGLSKVYRMGDVEVPALRSVDVDLCAGELVVILGASGSGKSTLLNNRENVQFVTEIAADPMRPQVALSLVGLGERVDHFPAQLSGGKPQRVAIARAIARRARSLRADGHDPMSAGLVVRERGRDVHPSAGLLGARGRSIDAPVTVPRIRGGHASPPAGQHRPR